MKKTDEVWCILMHGYLRNWSDPHLSVSKNQEMVVIQSHNNKPTPTYDLSRACRANVLG